MSAFKSNLLNELVEDDGYWRDPGGIHHDEPAGYLEGKLGFCGCGSPDEALRYVRDALAAIQALKQSDWSRQAVDALYAMYGIGERYFLWYRLDDLGLTEHGGSVPGWLTDKGTDWLIALNEVLEAA